MGYNKIVFGGTVLLDLTGDTVTPEALLAGLTAHNAAGELIVGTLTDSVEVGFHLYQTDTFPIQAEIDGTTYTGETFTASLPTDGGTVIIDCTQGGTVDGMACCVGYTMDGGETYTRLFGKQVSGNKYAFEVVPQAGMTIIAHLKGDVDENGKITSNDSNLVNRYRATTAAHIDPTPLQAFVGDVDGNGTLTSNDSSLINRHVAQTAAHKELEWDEVTPVTLTITENGPYSVEGYDQVVVNVTATE